MSPGVRLGTGVIIRHTGAHGILISFTITTVIITIGIIIIRVIIAVGIIIVTHGGITATIISRDGDTDPMCITTGIIVVISG